MNSDMTQQGERAIKIIKRADQPLSDQGERSELRLLSELIERNPDRAREFLSRLTDSMKVAV